MKVVITERYYHDRILSYRLVESLCVNKTTLCEKEGSSNRRKRKTVLQNTTRRTTIYDEFVKSDEKTPSLTSFPSLKVLVPEKHYMATTIVQEFVHAFFRIVSINELSDDNLSCRNIPRPILWY